MKKPIIAANWKMHKTQGEAVSFLETLCCSPVAKDREVWIAPSFTALSALDACRKKLNAPILLGAQNLSEHPEGPFTGEISAAQLVEAGANFVIIGHSERRQFYGETEIATRKKIERAVSQGMRPMLCVGETEAEREHGKTLSVLKKQLEGALHELSAPILNGIVIAYEPVWAIGTGKVATAQIANETHLALREMLTDLFGPEFAQAVSILYGGSVKPESISNLMSEREIDGVLVGGASLSSEAFQKIINY